MNTKVSWPQFTDFIKKWKKYKKQFPTTTQWLIMSDYCFDDKNKPNDCLTFTICPMTDIYKISDELIKNIPKDIKDITYASGELISYIKR